MFNSKKKQLFESGSKTKTSENAFINHGLKKSAETRSGNDAPKYSTTGNPFVDQFGSLGSYKAPREYIEIERDCITLYAKDPLLSIMFILYLRLITRVVTFFDGKKTETTQKGAGLRYESIMRMMWLYLNHEDLFWRNIKLFITVGSWKDIITMLQIDVMYHGWDDKVISWRKISDIILAGLENPNTTNLVKKYLPQIKANSKCHTVESQADNVVAKYLCSRLFEDRRLKSEKYYADYRKLKASGKAHVWQQLISQGRFLEINFDTIHGRALAQLVSSKFLKNNGLESKYEAWIAKKPVAKFTGYVYELAQKIDSRSLKKYQIDTINAQYRQLLEHAKGTQSDIIVVKDTSGSMDSTAIGTNMSSYHVAKSLSIYFGNLLQGVFANHYIDFSSNAILRAIIGNNFYEAWVSEHRTHSANTNFLSVAELFANTKNTEVPESDFPKGILCISDGEFDNPRNNGLAGKMFETTNIVAFKNILLNHGFSKEFVDNFKFIFWDIRNTFYNYKDEVKFESYNLEKNVFYFSGFDGSVISFLLQEEVKAEKPKAQPKDAYEVFLAAMNQEVLRLVEI